MNKDSTLCMQSYLLGYADANENKWNNCKDEMPEKDVDILIVDNGLVKFGIYSSFSAKFFTTNFEQFLDTENVTHWMPLPEPPTHI